MKSFYLIFVSIFILSGFQKVCSHPHVFVYSSVDAVFDKNGISGFRVYWKFDEMFSNMFIFDFDRNSNRVFEPEELKALENGGFRNLKKFNYFSHIKIEGKKFEVAYVKDFKAWIKGANLYYSFFIPCHVKGYDREKTIKIAIYDKSFYCSVFLTKKPLYFENADKFEVSNEIYKNMKEPYYFNQIFPQEITIRFRLKNE